MDAQLATTSGNISPKSVNFSLGIGEILSVFAIQFMQHLNMCVLVVNGIGQLLDLSYLVVIDAELFLIPRTV
ncbi:hypothetical protein XIS1_1440008 [Xenorhabdus innexi]|uniref:Uncharacterized protein n=1 Tax=Xenorhabdus innexi TaxID=290109 RepID=A0A1N6MU90_9GAMM|nr:hypothetical protein XIS1_1440008 [Xenorhabdus innexi]